MVNSREQTRSPHAVVKIDHFLVVAMCVLVGCGSSVDDREARALAAADPAQASSLVRRMTDRCENFARVLDVIAQSRITGRLLVGLVDEAISEARQRCPELVIRGKRIPHQLARARLAEDRPADALAALPPSDDAAVRYRRAELLDRLGRAAEALREIDAALARSPDDQGRMQRRLIAVSHAAATGDHAALARAITDAPLAERPRLAFRAVSVTPPAALDALATSTALELVIEAANRIEEQRGPAAALAARERVVAAMPDDADHWDTLARSRIAAGREDDALAAWDRAATIAPAQASYRLSPIKALVIAGSNDRARTRAAQLAKLGRDRADPELLETASAGAAAAGDVKLALALAQEARAKRPGDGKLAFLVAQRLAEAADMAAAADAYVELLFCGAHGRPWHRHEVAGKLLQLNQPERVRAALDAKRSCATVDAADLATYVTSLREGLAKQ